MDRKELRTRRQLLKGAALTGLTLPFAAARAEPEKYPVINTPDEKRFNLGYGSRAKFDTPQRIASTTANGAVLGAYTPLQDLEGIITPAPLHFIALHYAVSPPIIDPREHSLMIHGLVDRPLEFSVAEVKRLPSVSRVHFLECAGNSAPLFHSDARTVQTIHGWTSCSMWTGVLLSTLLQQAGVKKKARWILAEGADGAKHTFSIPLEKGMDNVIVAYAQNGEAVRPEQGYPLRLIVPGFIGVANVKYLRRLKLVDEPHMQRWETTGYVTARPNLGGKALWFDHEWGPKSVITRPSGGQVLDRPGYYQISGLAWSGAGSVRRVEVSTDGGRTWKDAEIEGPIHRKAHTRFRMDWTWKGGGAELQSRCTDDQGNVQPSQAELAKLIGAPGPEWFKTTGIIIHDNHIQPWRIDRDGTVHNALL